VLVWPSSTKAPNAAVQEYRTGTGVNYDKDGYAVIVAGDGEDAKPLAVWAPGQWQRAELREDRA
jgi:hypothetical protein